MMKRVTSGIVKPVAGFARGFSYPLRAIRLFRQQPGLLKYLMIPFSINFVVFSATVYFGLDLFQSMLNTYAPSTEAWYGVLLYYFAWILAMLLSTVLIFFTFTVVGNLIASPFNELLSERVENNVRGMMPEQPFTMKRFWQDAIYAVGTELKKITIFALCMILLFGINFIPGLGAPIYAILAPALTLFFLVVEYMAFVLMRKHMTFKEQRSYVFKHPVMMLGYACAVFVLLAVPFVQFFCIPLAVVGATLLWCDFPAENHG